MTKTASFFLFLLLTALTVGVSCSNSNSSGPSPDGGLSIVLSPSSATIDAGSSASVRVTVNNMRNLFALTLDLLFDNSTISVDSVILVQGTLFGSNSLVFSESISSGISIAAGMVQTAGVDGFTGSGPVIDIFYRGNLPGSTQLHISNMNMIDETGAPVPDFSSIKFEGASVTVE